MNAPDIIRVVALFEGVVSAVLSAISLYYFSKRNPPAGILSHVRRVTATYIAFVVYGVAEIITHFGAPYRWQMFAQIVVFSLAANAQVPLVRFEREAAKEERERLERA